MPVDPPIGGDPPFDPGSSGGGGTFPGQTSVGLKGYADLRNSVAHHLATNLRVSRGMGVTTLQVLGRRSKVGR